MVEWHAFTIKTSQLIITEGSLAGQHSQKVCQADTRALFRPTTTLKQESIAKATELRQRA